MENFEQIGKVMEFYLKYWKNEGILDKMLEKLGHFNQSLFFSDLLIQVYLLNRFLYLLNSLNKALEKVGEICETENVGTMMLTITLQIIA